MFKQLEKIYPLKATARKGWQLKAIRNPESVADHSYMLSMLCMMAKVHYPASEINFDHCIQIALIHDLAEAQVGDITPHDGISEDTKYKLEHDAFKHLPIEFKKLWMEYESQVTIESHFVKDCDKFDMIYQANIYEQSDKIELQEFFDSVSFKTDIVKEWAFHLFANRLKHLVN